MGKSGGGVVFCGGLKEEEVGVGDFVLKKRRRSSILSSCNLARAVD